MFIGIIGHFDNEFDFTWLEGLKGMIVDNIKHQVDRFVFPDVHRVIVLLGSTDWRVRELTYELPDGNNFTVGAKWLVR